MKHNASRPSPDPASTRRRSAKRAWLYAAAIAAVWAIEIYLLQARTLISESGWKAIEYTHALNYRLLINALFCGALVLLLPRWAQILGFLVLLLFTQAASFYHRYFGRGLSWTTIHTQFGEGADSVIFDKAFVLPGILALSLLFLAAKLGLLWAQRRHTLRWRVRIPVGLLLAAGYIATVLAFNTYGSTRLSGLRNWMSFDRVGVAHGYLVTWVGEFIYISHDELLTQALRAREQRDDRITPAEGRIELPGHLVLLQVESLDWHALGLRHDGRAVTPRLNALLDTAQVYQIQAIHRNGSADADFVMLHGCMVAPGVINYKIPRFPHDDTLPAAARAAGLPMTVLHGFRGNFYNRRAAYQQMDFEQVLMAEEMVDLHQLETQKWSAVPDGPVLELSARLLNQARSPQSHLIITYTSHTPFVILPEGTPEPFHNPDDRVYLRYFNAIHYVDQAIGAFLDALPEGTTVVIYSDHESAAGYPQRQRARGEPELIPLIVWRKGEDLSGHQHSGTLLETRHTETSPTGAGWSLIDAANWVRGWLEPVPPHGPTPPHPLPPVPQDLHEDGEVLQ